MAEAVATPEPGDSAEQGGGQNGHQGQAALDVSYNGITNVNQFSVILRDMILPARMKKGMASRALPFMPANIL